MDLCWHDGDWCVSLSLFIFMYVILWRPLQHEHEMHARRGGEAGARMTARQTPVRSLSAREVLPLT